MKAEELERVMPTLRAFAATGITTEEFARGMRRLAPVFRKLWPLFVAGLHARIDTERDELARIPWWRPWDRAAKRREIAELEALLVEEQSGG